MKYIIVLFNIILLMSFAALANAQTGTCNMSGKWTTNCGETLQLLENASNGQITGAAWLKSGNYLNGECGEASVTGQRTGTSVVLTVANYNSPPCAATVTFNLTTDCTYAANADGQRTGGAGNDGAAYLDKVVTSATLDRFFNLTCAGN